MGEKPAALRSSRRDEGWSFILAGNSFSQGELFFRRDFFSQSKLFFKTRTSFHKGNFFSQTARCSLTHESWELVPLDELSLAGILQLWNRRFQVSGMQSPIINCNSLRLCALECSQSPFWHRAIRRPGRKTGCGIVPNANQ